METCEYATRNLHTDSLEINKFWKSFSEQTDLINYSYNIYICLVMKQSVINQV